MSIEVKNVSYTYMKETPFERRALTEVSMNIEEGTVTAIAGATGSGKSTLLQLFNGLLSPTTGEVFVDGVNLANSDRKTRQQIRQKVGVVFQYPEAQLFAETVFDDIAFAPRQLGLSEAETEDRVRKAMQYVELEYEYYKNRPPFRLSGGERRRVAIAGVLAMDSKYLVLDEPTAGLDPAGEEALIRLLEQLHKVKTIVIVTHNMDDILRLADKMILVDNGKVILSDTPINIFSRTDILQKPQKLIFIDKLKQAGIEIRPTRKTEEIIETIIRIIKRKQQTI